MQKRHPSPKKLTVTVLSGGRESKTVSAPTHKERFNLIVLYNKNRRKAADSNQTPVSNGLVGEEEQLRERALIYRISRSKRYIAYSEWHARRESNPQPHP